MPTPSTVRPILNARELATVLVGLRHLREAYESVHPEELKADYCEHFADVEPLSMQEVDALCERINCAGDESPFAKSHERQEAEDRIAALDKQYHDGALSTRQLREKLAALVGPHVQRDEMELFEFEISGIAGLDLGAERLAIVSSALRTAAGTYRACARDMAQADPTGRLAERFRRQARDAELMARWVAAADSGKLRGSGKVLAE